MEVKYPLGHRRRRKEGIPVLLEKFERHVASRFAAKQARAIAGLCLDRRRLLATSVNELLDVMTE